MARKRRFSTRYLLVALWVVFTVSLSGWWVIFGFEQIDRLSALGVGNAEDAVRYQRMLLYEGVTLFFSLFAGGATLAYYMYREVKQADQLRNFFLSFTHDARTSLATVQLHAELLKERLGAATDAATCDQLLAELQRLTLQLENSLYVGNLENQRMHLERINLAEMLETLRARFPQLEIEAATLPAIKADIRALESVFLNLLHNAVVHGRATTVRIVASKGGSGDVTLEVTDDGAGFRGERKRLGQRYFRPYSGSGAGLGLSLVSALMRAMGGAVAYPETARGFGVRLKLQEA
ncbi:MAG: sensor histidine kinase [Proteobacteria bacterium]|nr:sensor histidine kinase [Pseudomonadota bacterium]